MTDRNYGSDERTELDRQSEHENHFSAQGETRGLFQKRRRVARSGQAAADPLSNKRRKQQQTAAALGVVGILGALSLWAVTSNPDERKTHKKPEPAASIAIHPEYVQRETYIRKSEAKIDELNNTVASLTSDIAALRKELESTAKSLTETMRRQKDTLATLEEVQAKHGAAIESAAEAAAASGGQMRAPGESGFDYGALDASLTGNAETRSGLLENSPGSTGRTQLTVVTLGAPKDRRTLPPAAKTADERRLPRYAPSTWLAPDTPIAVNRAPGSTVDTYLPPGAFARATLLTGVYASTGGAAGDPMPVLMQIENPAVLPGRMKLNMTACMLTGTATGDLSSERVQIRLDRLSCVGKNGETLDVRISGYAVGADGKVGVRGRLVTRSGQAIAAAISTSMLQGIGRAVSLSSQQTTTSLSTGTQTVDYANAWRGGLGDGFAKGMDRISAYFLRLAEKILPVLEVDAGSPVDIVVSRGVLLADR